jgi:hypothetical protein
MTRRIGVCAAVLFVLTTAGEVKAQTPVREGFTLELGLGGAVTTANDQINGFVPGSGGIPTSRTFRTSGGLAPLSLSLGVFLDPRLALMFRIAGTTYTPTFYAYVNDFIGPVVQYWPDDHWFVGAGAGLALFGPAPFSSAAGSAAPDGGLGLTARVGASPFVFEKHWLGMTLETFPSFYRNGLAVYGFALNVEWQLL